MSGNARPKKRYSAQMWDVLHYKQTEQYARAVDALFDAATKNIAVAATKGDVDTEKPFSFADYPAVNAVMQEVTMQLAARINKTIETGARNEWNYACRKSDAFLASIMDTSKLAKSDLEEMQDRNLDALKTFQGRKVAGLNLSERVWNYVGQYREQMETALDVGLGEGRSPQQLARDVKQNLKDPDRLFRRVRDKRGNLVLSKAAKAFHPGQGVYRSSVKNAQRLTRSEINMAYRESDYLRWQQLDFVVGFEVFRSNHEPLCKCDICAKLVGKYPKTFKFVGWHPQCMCYAVPVLRDFYSQEASDDRVNRFRAALYGTEYKKYTPKNTVTDVPAGFKEWVNGHVDAQKKWASTPYFIRDNFKNGSLAEGLKIALPTIPKVAPAPIPAPAQQMPDTEVDLSKNGIKIDGNVAGNNIVPAQQRIDDAVVRPQKPTFDYVADNNKKPIEERAKNVAEGLLALYGKDNNVPNGFENWWKHIKGQYAVSLESSVPQVYAKEVVSAFTKVAKYGIADQLKAINHWNELAAAKDLGKIPVAWRQLFNGYVRKIEAMDIGAVGYVTAYREIEAAYNIYKLSLSPMAAKYGLDKISAKMPYQLFEELNKKLKIDITKTMPKKEFFDSLEEFVPLSTSGMKGESCYFNPTFKHVRIPFNIDDVTRRLEQSESYRTKILYHEFGHARDFLSKVQWHKSKEWNDLFNRFRDEVNRDNGKALEAALNEKFRMLKSNGSVISRSNIEQFSAYSDTLQALVDGHRWIGNGGHAASYWKGDNMLIELIAHASENYWGGNELFKELYPDLYREMCKLVKKMCNQ
ncbi:MAG: hypothetical protein NC324_02580 [Bacteroides sp.]|nr:hypothetical protein [Bacteroides sp.]